MVPQLELGLAAVSKHRLRQLSAGSQLSLLAQLSACLLAVEPVLATVAVAVILKRTIQALSHLRCARL
jgi:hypothetical protein